MNIALRRALILPIKKRGNAESPLNKPCKIFYHISKEIARGFTEKNIEILRSKL